MIEILFQILSLSSSILAFFTIVMFVRSNIKFTKGELQKIINYFIWGTIFIFGATMAQLQVDLFNLSHTLIDIIKYILLMISLFYYLLASKRIYKMSKVLGFASEEIPKKLKKVLKS